MGRRHKNNNSTNNDNCIVLIYSAVIKRAVEQGHIEGFTVNGSSGGYGADGRDGGVVINVRAGAAIRIDLKISGSPTPTVTWLKDHKPISLSNRVRRSAQYVDYHIISYHIISNL